MKILLAENQPEVRSALKLLLEEAAGLAVNYEAINSDAVLEWVEHDCPDILFLEWELPGVHGSELIYQIRARCERSVIITLSTQSGVEKDAINAGADGFICKGSLPQEVIATLIKCLEMKFPVYD